MSRGNQNHILLSYTVVDVFTETIYAGNPLAIVRLPPQDQFSPQQAQLQSIASEFNLSETIFLEDATSEDIKQRIRRARIFTATREILFAGHPTVGAATWLKYLGSPLSDTVDTLVPGAGSIPISKVLSRPGYVSAVTPHTFHLHRQQLSAHQVIALHSTIQPYVLSDRSFPIVSIVHGMTFVLVELDDLEALAAVRLGNQNNNVYADSGILDSGWEYSSPLGMYFYVRQAESPEQDIESIRTRMFVRGIEDPATGSAASALTGYLASTEAWHQKSIREWKIVQGVEMARRSELGLSVELASSGDARDMKIVLTGTAVIVCEGTVCVLNQSS